LDEDKKKYNSNGRRVGKDFAGYNQKPNTKNRRKIKERT
jgi:hypothetical protein